MGVYHQGGVVPVQVWLGQEQTDLTASTTEVFWWRTYSPPIWLLNHSPLNTTDLMGMPLVEMQARIMTALDGSDPQEKVEEEAQSTSSSKKQQQQQQNGKEVESESETNKKCDSSSSRSVGLVAPLSSLELDSWRYKSRVQLQWKEVYRYTQHLNMDDLDFGGTPSGPWAEVRRVLGRRGLGVWIVERRRREGCR